MAEPMTIELAGEEVVNVGQEQELEEGVHVCFPNPGNDARVSEGGVGRALPLCQAHLQNCAYIISCDPHNSAAR